MELKATLKDYTAAEFQALVDRIWAVDLPKQAHDRLINHFDAIVGHPLGADLLFYLDDRFGSNSTYLVVEHVRGWHEKQGRATFKQDAAVPRPPAPLTPVGRSLAEVQEMAADIAVSDQAVERAFQAFEQAIRNFRDQQGVERDISAQERNIRTLERAQHETLMAIRKFEFWKMRIEFVKSSAQRNLTYARSEQAQWQGIAQQINATYSQYLARLTAITHRHRVVHDDAEALLILAQEQLIRSRNLAEPDPTHAAYVISGSLSFADKRPAVLLDGEPSALLLSQQIDLLKAIRSAVAEFTWQNASGEPTDENQTAAVLQFEFSSRADTRLFGLGVPLIELMPIEGQDWQLLAAGRSEVKMPFRMGTAVVPAKPGSMFKGLREIKKLEQIHISATRPGTSNARVRVRAAQQDGQRNSFSFTADGAAPITLNWSAPIAEDAISPAPTPAYRLGFIYPATVPALGQLVEQALVSRSEDYIVVFPPESGLEPLYVMLRS